MAEQEVVKSIRAALEHNQAVNIHQYPLDIVSQEDTIRLSGTAPNIAFKKEALRTAKANTNGAPVIDAIRVEVSDQRADAELRQAVLKHLTLESVFSGYALNEGSACPEGHDGDWLAVDAHDGIVRLTGRVNSLSHRRLAEVIAWWTPGTADVDNRIHVEPPETDSDSEILDAIRIIFDKEPGIDPEQVRAQCHNRVVTLQGTVSSEENRRVAAFDCFYIPGVHEVHNELRVP